MNLEHIPSKSWIEQGNAINVELIVNKKSSSSPANAGSSYAALIFPYTCLILTALITVIIVYSESHLPIVLPIRNWCNEADRVLIDRKIIGKRGACIESIMAGIAWALTNLFIRRLLNPETAATAIQKYAADALFGGFAASAGVFVKHALSMTLSN